MKIHDWLPLLPAIGTMLLMQLYLGRLGPRLLRLQLGFSRRHFWTLVDELTPEQRQRVRRHFAIDYVFIACYSGFGLWTAATVPSAPQSSALLLPLAGLLDIAENRLHCRFLDRGRDEAPDALYRLSGCISTLKWLLSLVSLAQLLRA